jgi:putative zinc finger/helix-turn-helix YgiT family protein
MKMTKGDYPYTESGLENVILKGTPLHKCSSCGEVMPELKNVEHIHRLIADALVKKNTRLTGKEMRFLRKEMGMNSLDFAHAIGVTPVSVSRWENGKEKVGIVSEKLARMLYVQMMQELSHKVCKGVFSDIRSIRQEESKSPLTINLSSHELSCLAPA